MAAAALVSLALMLVAGSPPAGAQNPPENSPATGTPTISGKAQVGETLTVDTSAISDPDGIENVCFVHPRHTSDGPNELCGSDKFVAEYQWVSDDGTYDAGMGSRLHNTSFGLPSFTVPQTAEGQTMWVRVLFQDDDGNYESVHTAETATIAPANLPARGLPTISGWARVGYTLTADTSGIADDDGLEGVSWSYQWLADDSDIAEATSSAYTLQASDHAKTIKVRVEFTDDAGNDESLTSEPTEAVNSPATGAPIIRGQVLVGETLTVDTSAISDLDGVENVCFVQSLPRWSPQFCESDKFIAQYTWSAVDSTNNVGEVGDGGYLLSTSSGDPTFVIPSWVGGMTLWVEVLFEDDAGSGESVHSAETATVAEYPQPTAPTAITELQLSPGDSGELDMRWSVPAYGDGGSLITGWTVQWKQADGSWDTVDDVSEHEITVNDWATTGSYTITGLTDGTAVTARVIATNEVGDSAPSAELTATPGSQLSLSGISSRDFEENYWGSMSRITLPVPDGTEATHDLADHYRLHGAADDATIAWSLSGDDAEDFTIYGAASSNYAFLQFAAAPDYESPDDADVDNLYKVTVQATDGTNTATIDVTVNVTDVDEPPDPTAQDIGGL